jgi:nucleoside-diphosphate-sugar epimerase
MKSTSADIGKAKELLGWEPSVSVEEGVKKSVEWYKENLPWSSEIKLTE